MADTSTHHPSHYAILIGIDAYPDSPLRGCVADIQEVSKALKQSVDGVRICAFTATPSPENEPSQVACTEREESRPTYENISSCLEQVAKQLHAGDHVYLHYSGHSTVTPPLGPHSNADKGDLALSVIDGPSASGIRYYYGQELAMSLRRMVDRGATVTMVLDCCYAGSTLRNDSVVRYIEYDAEVEKRYPRRQWPDETNPSSTESAFGNSALRRASMAPNWLVHPQGYAILAAGDGTEKAYHVRFEDPCSPRHGALTWFLLDCFDMLGGVGGSMSQLCEAIGARIREYNHHKTRKVQNPVLFGNRKQHFFGCSRPGGRAGEIAITSSPGLGGGMALQLHAGRAHGISEADRFELWPLGSREQVSPVIAEVAAVRGVTSDLVVVDGRDSSVATGWLAAAQTHRSLQRFPILLFGFPGDAYNEWRKAAWKLGMSAEAGETEDVREEPGFAFSIARKGDIEYEISESSPSGSTATLAVERGMHRVLGQVQHLALFRLARELTNTGDDQLRTPVAVHLVKGGRGEGISVFPPGCRETDDIFASCYHPACVVTVTEDDMVKLRVENKAAAQDRTSLLVYVYALGSGGEIEECLKASREVVPANGSGTDRGHVASGVWEKKLEFSLEEGQTSCEDILKVFITVQPTSFATWILPKLGTAVGSRAPNKGLWGERRGGSVSEEWAVMTFRVRLH